MEIDSLALSVLNSCDHILLNVERHGFIPVLFDLLADVLQGHGEQLLDSVRAVKQIVQDNLLSASVHDAVSNVRCQHAILVVFLENVKVFKLRGWIVVNSRLADGSNVLPDLNLIFN